MTPTIGRTVHYILTGADVAQINRRRTTSDSIRERIIAGTWPVGAQAHMGSPVEVGDTVAMIITLVVNEVMVSGRCILDGTDELWVQHVPLGDEHGTWQWPTRV